MIGKHTLSIYSILCGDCAKIYLGQTRRQFCPRLKEHQMAVFNSNNSKSALAEHVCQENHDIAWDDSKIITIINNRYGAFVRKSVISTRIFVPKTGMTAAILLLDDIMRVDSI